MGLKFFSLFLGLSHPNLAKNNAEKLFPNFLNFFPIFFRNFRTRVEFERNWGLKLFSLFLGRFHPDMAKNNAEKLFSNFLNFFAIFFGNLLPRVEYERNSGLKFFYLFLGLSNPIYDVLAKKNDGKLFFNFLNFFAIFFRNFLPRVEYKRNSGLKFLYLFLDLSQSFSSCFG